MHIVIRERELVIAAIVLILFGALGYGLYQMGNLETKPANDRVVMAEEDQTWQDVAQDDTPKTDSEATEDAVAFVLEDAIKAITRETDAEPNMETTTHAVVTTQPSTEEALTLNEAQQNMIDSKTPESATNTANDSPSAIKQMAVFFEQLIETQPNSVSEPSDTTAQTSEKTLAPDNATGSTESQRLREQTPVLLDEAAELMVLESDTIANNASEEEEPQAVEIIVVEDAPQTPVAEATMTETAVAELSEKSHENNRDVLAANQPQNKEAEASENEKLRAQLANAVKKMSAMQQRLDMLEAKLAEKEAATTSEGAGITTLKPEAKTDQTKTRTVVVKEGDNLWEIADRIYGDGLLYPRIQAANPELIKNPNLIKKGQVLRVPM